MNEKIFPGPGGNRGLFDAWDPVARKVVWTIKENFPVWSGALATAGNVVFYGTMEGWFKAIDAKSGQELWKFKTGSGIIGQPVTWRGPDGKQYVSILSGVGGWSGAIVAGGLDPRDGTAALGFVNALRDPPHETTPGGVLDVFAPPRRPVEGDRAPGGRLCPAGPDAEDAEMGGVRRSQHPAVLQSAAGR